MGFNKWLQIVLATIVYHALGCEQEPHHVDYLTVDQINEAVADEPDAFDGQKVTVRGWAYTEFLMTQVACTPQRCDCNSSNLSLHLLPDNSLLGPSVFIADLICDGNVCTMTCTPFDPRSADAYEFVGALVPYATVCEQGGVPGDDDGKCKTMMKLDAVDIGASSRLVGGDDLSSMDKLPIETGEFVLDLPEDVIP
jgi:hypothetical protein